MTRMLVEPRRQRDGQLTGCTGVTMEDGTVYRADRTGHIDVSRPDHVAAMVNNPLAPGHVAIQKFHGGGTAGASCTACGFSAFTWQCSAPCPRCGGSIEKECP